MGDDEMLPRVYQKHNLSFESIDKRENWIKMVPAFVRQKADGTTIASSSSAAHTLALQALTAVRMSHMVSAQVIEEAMPSPDAAAFGDNLFKLVALTDFADCMVYRASRYAQGHG